MKAVDSFGKYFLATSSDVVRVDAVMWAGVTLIMPERP
jgi:hypothetical protein